jgi:hypothetical protein
MALPFEQMLEVNVEATDTPKEEQEQGYYQLPTAQEIVKRSISQVGE